MQAGDRIALRDGVSDILLAKAAIHGADIPSRTKVYRLKAINHDNNDSLIIEGLNHGKSKGWNKKFWRVVPGESTSDSRKLAALFDERDGCPEDMPGEIRYLPEEKVFDKNQEF